MDNGERHAAARGARLEEIRAKLLAQMNELERDLDALDASHRRTVELQAELARAIAAFHEGLKRCLAPPPGPASTDSIDLSVALEQAREMNMSFNLQYLQLQNQMQNENRQFTMVSNIMKTKHDTVKNSISNIR